MNDFAPLRIVSCYSFLQSGLTIEKIQTSAVKNDYFGIGLADKGVLFGVPAFVKASEAINKPYIIGLEVNIFEDTFCLYALNEEGYHNLLQISTAIQKEQLNEDLFKKLTNGLLAVLVTYSGKFKQLFINNDTSFTRYLFNYSKIFTSFYLGIEVIDKDGVSYANKIRKFADEHSYDCVALPRILYQKKEDAIVLKIVEAIKNEDTLTEKKLDGQNYFMSIDSYQKIYTQKEILNTKKIVNATTFDFHQKRGELLHYPVNDPASTLKENCYKRLNELRLNQNDTYIKRLDYELDVIISMGYADYFLIVQDYVSFAKKNHILVGPGRGSAAGSLVSYLLDITQLDPIKNDLKFERFLNPYRQSMPDIDIDFMDIRRDEVVQYLRDKYGNDRVANIVTFQTIQAKQSLRDIGRVYGYKNNWIDLLSKRISKNNISLRQAYKTLPEFKQLVDSDSYFLEIVSLASKIEGLIRQNSLHAAGIILNNSPLENALPILVDFSNHYISQYEMSSLEEQGFLKMDFLGLRNLTTIAKCVELINRHYPDAKIDAQNVPFDDPKAFSLIASTQTMGLFQIESSGMKRAIKALKPTCFDDIVALNAIFRPGALDEVKNYGDRKNNRAPIIYDDPILENILKPTYGVIVYQEQVMEIATVMAGFNMSEADLFRSAISKKNIEKMKKSEKAFKEGAIKNGHDAKIVDKIFDSIMKFSNYGLNKSHAAAYATIACQMAYLKAYYPLEFYAAILETSSSASDAKFNEYISEMKNRNIAIFSPNINLSNKEFSVVDNGLLFPLNAIHGVDELTINSILNERKEKPFDDFFDFVKRLYKYKITDSKINALIDAGCFDIFTPSRASLRTSLRSALQYAELVSKEDGQIDLGVSSYIKPYLIEETDDPLDNLDKEYSALGIMLSNTPLHYKKDILENKNVISISDAKEIKKSKIAGLIRSVKTISAKKGTMAFIKLADESNEIELTVFADLYAKSVDLLRKNQIIIADIEAKNRNDEIDYIANSITPLEEEQYE